MMPREMLIAARKLISDPKRWTQHALARDSEGEPVLALAWTAKQWCAVGALQRVSGRRYPPVFRGGLSTRDNDSGTHADALAMFDEAIAGLDKIEPILGQTKEVDP